MRVPPQCRRSAGLDGVIKVGISGCPTHREYQLSREYDVQKHVVVFSEADPPELILPADLADRIRALARSGRERDGIITIRFSAFDEHSVDRLFRNHPGRITGDEH
jgi:hypothetical protein